MEIEQLKGIIICSLTLLAQRDDDILRLRVPKIPRGSTREKATEREKLLNRELHETTLNHRFAFYLETQLLKEGINEFSVDIEYNRNFGNTKNVLIETQDIPIRPDILIHKRMSEDDDNHLLAVEAKKRKISQHDLNKIKALMTDTRYLYKYGLTISYSEDQHNIRGILHYKNCNDKIDEEQIVVKRKRN